MREHLRPFFGVHQLNTRNGRHVLAQKMAGELAACLSFGNSQTVKCSGSARLGVFMPPIIPLSRTPTSRHPNCASWNASCPSRCWRCPRIFVLVAVGRTIHRGPWMGPRFPGLNWSGWCDFVLFPALFVSVPIARGKIDFLPPRRLKLAALL